MAALLAGCNTLSLSNTSEPRPGFQGLIAADEPRAVLAARDALNQGGTAGDAATALALTLAVTFPSRASLGSGGACLFRTGRPPDPEQGLIFNSMRPKIVPPETMALDFQAPAAAPGVPPAPMLVRGIALLHARLGTLRLEQHIARAEALARQGAPVSRAFARDIAAAGAPVTGPSGQPLKEGDVLPQPELSATFAALRSRGPNELYAGQLGEAYAAATGIAPSLLRASVATVTPARGDESGNDRIYFAPTAGGELTAAIWREARGDRRSSRREAEQRAAAFQAALTKSGATPVALGPDSGGTSFVVVDARGGSVACTLTMGRLFGSRRVAGATGILAAAPVDENPAAPAALSALIVANENTGQFVAGMTDAGDPVALARIALDSLLGGRPLDEPFAQLRTGDEWTRVNAARCPSGLPRDPGACTIKSDPRGNGMAVAAEGG